MSSGVLIYHKFSEHLLKKFKEIDKESLYFELKTDRVKLIYEAN